ncbi:hypothetical protein JZ751_015654 [Albula glossodonta]|uniref:Plectin/eS10 N-terminal domain-containing protein n=1 Tax=Albula glossodonta TaxID=121402 RepID=A0A8T2NZF1_9TELE|nr:hypothetical protein JZ751_015654 [Albula glossodonta]
MVMPLEDLRAIYELLFRDGVLVAKKDKRPQSKHPEIRGVTNLQVMRAMGSLKSRGYVRETFAWRHFYWYLTNEGIVYLRDYLRLPAEIVPSSLQRVRRPATTLNITHRAARVQTLDGPVSYAPKPTSRAALESQESLMDRQGYRRKRIGDGEEEATAERMPRFRGRPIAADKPRASWEFGVEGQQGLRNGEVHRKEVRVTMEESQMTRSSAAKFSQPPLDAKSTKPTAVAASEERVSAGGRKGARQGAGVQKMSMTSEPVTVTEQATAKAVLPAAVAPAVGVGAVAAASVVATMAPAPTKVAKEKAKKASTELIHQEDPKMTLDITARKPMTATSWAESSLPTMQAKDVKAERELPKKPAKENVAAIQKSTPAPLSTPPPTSAPASSTENAERQIKASAVVDVTSEVSKPAPPQPKAADREVTVKSEVTVVTQVTREKAWKIAETQKSPEPGPVAPVPAAAPVAAAEPEATPSAPAKTVNSEIKKTFEVMVTLEQPEPQLLKIPNEPAVTVMVGQSETSNNQPTQSVSQSPKENAVAQVLPLSATADPTLNATQALPLVQVTQDTPKSSSEVITPESVPAKPEAAGTSNEVKVTTVTAMEVTMTQTTALLNAPVSALPQATGKPITADESSVSTGGKKEKQKNADREKKKRETPIPPSSVEIAEPMAPSAPAERAQAGVRAEAPLQAEEITAKLSSGPSPQAVPSAQITPAAAVRSQASAPTDKGKAGLAEFTEENMKQEVPELSSESKPPAAVLAAAAAAGADASTRAAQGGPPSLTSDCASPAQHKQGSSDAALNKASEKRELQPDPQTTAASEPDTDTESLDAANMRKKIVVVEEVIEVQHLNAAQAGQELQGQPLPAGEDPDPASQDIDIDILTELALERAARADAEGASHHPYPGQDWDHGLEEPEEKSWPNFIEGLKAFQPFPSSCPASVMSRLLPGFRCKVAIVMSVVIAWLNMVIVWPEYVPSYRTETPVTTVSVSV